MKICPQCDQSFNDDSLNFCLIDGTPLVASESQPTIVMPIAAAETVVLPRAPETAVVARKGSGTIWIVVAVAAMTMLVVTVVAAGFLIYYYTGKYDNPVGNRNAVVPASSAPKAAPPKSSPSPMASPFDEPGAKGIDRLPTPSNDEPGEPTPIAWNTSAVTFSGESGKTYTFECPENGTVSAVWGSDVYTGDSSICTAAVHAGIITIEDGGEVTIEFRPGRSTYGSTTRNGITTSTFGEYNRSFVVR